MSQFSTGLTIMGTHASHSKCLDWAYSTFWWVKTCKLLNNAYNVINLTEISLIIHSERTITSLIRWIKFAIFLINCAMPLSFYMRTNSPTPTWSLRIFSSSTPTLPRLSILERWALLDWEYCAEFNWKKSSHYQMHRIVTFAALRTPTSD